MVLNNVLLMDNPYPQNIEVIDGKISAITKPNASVNRSQSQISFNDAAVFPGLINSHDHLDFNLYPQFGDKIYNNYTEWGSYLHKNYKDEIASVLKIPLRLREQWGVYKNLICGVTTVVNHGEKVVIKNAPITVFENTTCLHSVQFEKDWKVKLNNPFNRNLPVSIHIGEGSDDLASSEIDQLIKWNLLKKQLVGIHAVAMTEQQAKKFEAIVWCPGSNYFLLNKTASVEHLKKATKVLFGTDSTLTANWDIREHIWLANKTEKFSKKELYETLNKNAADVWKLNTGEIAIGKDADLIVAKAKENNADTFVGLSPADLLLVMHQGNIRLFDESLLPQMSQLDMNNFSKIYIGGVCKYVEGDLPGLMQQIKTYNPAIDFPVSVNP
jgi:cytosine/adenosine deaminase-related metal-dependent hydrolase